ncbi:MAG: phosphoribosylglycinamide formyltransferase-1 [Phenylobacterium sp.]|jgi:phosphoribosylglycinamide formyltransferase-1
MNQSTTKPASIVVLISGNGSNLQAIIDACAEAKINGTVTAVISNRPGVFGLNRAEEAEIDAIELDHKKFASREDYDCALTQTIDEYQPDLVVLAGFMRILTAGFVGHYLGRLINIHPSLLPKYQGLHTHQRAIDAGDTEHGVSVHFVTEELDGGPVILQAKIPVFAEDDVDELAERVHEQEHRIYPLVVNWFCDGRLTMDGGQAILDGTIIPSGGYAND